jgi:transposase-like protein
MPRLTSAQRCERATVRMQQADADRLQAMIDMHAEGFSTMQIAEYAGMSDVGVLKTLRRAGVDTSRRGER